MTPRPNPAVRKPQSTARIARLASKGSDGHLSSLDLLDEADIDPTPDEMVEARLPEGRGRRNNRSSPQSDLSSSHAALFQGKVMSYLQDQAAFTSRRKQPLYGRVRQSNAYCVRFRSAERGRFIKNGNNTCNSRRLVAIMAGPGRIVFACAVRGPCCLGLPQTSLDNVDSSHLMSIIAINSSSSWHGRGSPSIVPPRVCMWRPRFEQMMSDLLLAIATVTRSK
ncbi:MAG: hypothetical protein EOO38_29000 [Cytophagaceae bacterium]|nr:MAG: hypothetical protein EOO38_29000 [Cytophagaceae bacterium]